MTRIALEVARTEATSEIPRYRRIIEAIGRAIELGTLIPVILPLKSGPT